MSETEILNPTWATWEEFFTEYDAWRVTYEASPSAAPRFFKGGEILPDGSTVLESVASPIQAEIVPRTKLDMKTLYEFDPMVDSRGDIQGTHAKSTRFYKEFITDMEKAKEGDVEEYWVNFNNPTPKFRKSRRDYPKRGTI